MWKRVVWGIVILIFSVSLVTAQDDPKVVIDAENVRQFQSVNQINFDDLLRAAWGGWRIESGRFRVSTDGERIAIAETNNGVLVFDIYGTPDGAYSVMGQDGHPSTFLEAIFDPGHEVIASIHTDGASYYLSQFDYGTGEYNQQKFMQTITATWFGENKLWLELENEIGYVQPDSSLVVDPAASRVLADPESVIRIGRIDPPLAVTVTEDGRVKRWNMETGEVTAEVQVNPEDGLPIYGALNAGGDSDLAWRDPASTALHILSFETGEDRTVVPLNGAYIPFIFLTQQSDVIIGVNIDDEPIVVAWDVATGERYDLGAYRQCNRPPDMVRLSQDGTTLVIGCDTGLDIWRVGEQ